jgi:hypothetical protein
MESNRPKIKLDILSYLEQKEIGHGKPTSSGFIILNECLFCGGKKKMGIYIENEKFSYGFVNCFSGKCGTKGGFEVAMAQIEDINIKEARAKLYKSKSYSGITKKRRKVSIVAATVENIDSKTIFDIKTISRPAESEDIKKGDKYWEYLSKRNISDEDIERMKCLKISFDSVKEFDDHIKETEENKIIIGIKTAIKYKIPINGDFEDELRKYGFSEEDSESVKEILVSRRLIDRVIITTYVNRKLVGYVARDITGNKTPKVLNSVGELPVWNFDSIKKSQTIVINEGIVDSVKSGLSRSVSLLGKNVRLSSKINSLKLLNPKEYIIFIDTGAEYESLSIHGMLSAKNAIIKIVELDPILIVGDIPNSEIEEINYLLGTNITTTPLRDSIKIMPCDHYSLKMAKMAIEGRESKLIERLILSSKYTENFKKKLISKISSISPGAPISKTIVNVAKTDYSDAGDMTIEEAECVISNSKECDVTSYKKRHKIA